MLCYQISLTCAVIWTNLIIFGYYDQSIKNKKIHNIHYRDNYGLGDRSCLNHTKLSYFIYNPRGVSEGDYIILITKLSVIICYREVNESIVITIVMKAT